MFRTRRVALGATMAISALIVPGAAGAQATTAHSAKVLDARTSGIFNPTVENDPVQVWDHVGTRSRHG
jgi:hypothetical protein